MPTNDFGLVLSIAGFYLSLIGLLGSLFFIRLSSWYKDIGTTEQKWKRFKNLNDREKCIECYLETFDEKSPISLIGFLLLTAFMLVMGVLTQRLRSTLPAGESMSFYLYFPIYLFFGLFFVSSMIFLVLGYIKVNRLFRDINEKLA